jgi:hypothetical protein
MTFFPSRLEIALYHASTENTSGPLAPALHTVPSTGGSSAMNHARLDTPIRALRAENPSSHHHIHTLVLRTLCVHLKHASQMHIALGTGLGLLRLAVQPLLTAVFGIHLIQRYTSPPTDFY